MQSNNEKSLRKKRLEEYIDLDERQYILTINEFDKFLTDKNFDIEVCNRNNFKTDIITHTDVVDKYFDIIDDINQPIHNTSYNTECIDEQCTLIYDEYIPESGYHEGYESDTQDNMNEHL